MVPCRWDRIDHVVCMENTFGSILSFGRCPTFGSIAFGELIASTWLPWPTSTKPLRFPTGGTRAQSSFQIDSVGTQCQKTLTTLMSPQSLIATLIIYRSSFQVIGTLESATRNFITKIENIGTTQDHCMRALLRRAVTTACPTPTMLDVLQ